MTVTRHVRDATHGVTPVTPASNGMTETRTRTPFGLAVSAVNIMADDLRALL